MRHPIEKYNRQQAATLAELPESQREYMARLFRIGNATYCYYQRANELSVFSKGIPASLNDSVETVDDLVEWLKQQIDPRKESRSAHELLNVYFGEYLAGLPHEGLRRTMQQEGLDKAKRSLPFRRYVLERHDIGMDEYLRQHLSPEDYAFYLSTSKRE